jgi:hypothetical protein
MSKHYEKHAEEVTKAFLDLLDEAGRAVLTQAHRDELAMLIEAAISTAVFEQIERAADRVARLSDELRHDAEHYDAAGD